MCQVQQSIVCGPERFQAHRCVLAARSAFFSGMFKSGKGMSEGGGKAAGQDIVIKEVSAGAFRVLLRFLYENVLPEDEDGEEALSPDEIARVADRFQVEVLYEHCVGSFWRQRVLQTRSRGWYWRMAQSLLL